MTELVSLGTGFPAIHNDQAGYQMLINAGYAPEDARDWNNCGCVVPHYTNTFEWTSAVNVNFTAALEYALNQGRSRLSGDMIGLQEKDPRDFSSYQEVEQAFFRQFDRLIEIAVRYRCWLKAPHRIGTAPFLSSLNKDCLASGQDLVDGGAKYNLGPVLTGIGLAVTANSLEAIKQLVFEDKVVDMATMIDALDKNWEGYEELRGLQKRRQIRQ